MRITTQQPKPPKEIVMVFSRDDGWAIAAALRDYASLHPSAIEVEKWREWAKELDAILRGEGQ